MIKLDIFLKVFKNSVSARSLFIVDFTQISNNVVPYANLNLLTKSLSINILYSS